jgi:hypothetical protein
VNANNIAVPVKGPHVNGFLGWTFSVLSRTSARSGGAWQRDTQMYIYVYIYIYAYINNCFRPKSCLCAAVHWQLRR